MSRERLEKKLEISYQAAERPVCALSVSKSPSAEECAKERRREHCKGREGGTRRYIPILGSRVVGTHKDAGHRLVSLASRRCQRRALSEGCAARSLANGGGWVPSLRQTVEPFGRDSQQPSESVVDFVSNQQACNTLDWRILNGRFE